MLWNGATLLKCFSLCVAPFHYQFNTKPVGMNITRRPPQGLERQGQTGGYSYQRDWFNTHVNTAS